jgi:hypothetical protein
VHNRQALGAVLILRPVFAAGFRAMFVLLLTCYAELGFATMAKHVHGNYADSKRDPYPIVSKPLHLFLLFVLYHPN